MKKNLILLSAIYTTIFSLSANAQKGEVFSTLEVSHPTCHGGTDGYIKLNLNPEAAPYQVQWTTGDTTALLNGLSAGSYGLTLISAYGDTITDLITLPDPQEITISTTLQQPTGASSMNGAIDVTVENTQGTYTFNWSTSNGSGLNPDNEDQSQLNPGTYVLNVEDQNGCQVTASVNLHVTPGPLSDAITIATTPAAPIGLNGHLSTTLHPGSIKLRMGENSVGFELYFLSGLKVETPNVEVGTASIQELDLEKGTYIAIFRYKDNSFSKQVFTVN
jgi:hypothetical protein